MTANLCDRFACYGVGTGLGSDDGDGRSRCREQKRRCNSQWLIIVARILLSITFRLFDLQCAAAASVDGTVSQLSSASILANPLPAGVR